MGMPMHIARRPRGMIRRESGVPVPAEEAKYFMDGGMYDWRFPQQ